MTKLAKILSTALIVVAFSFKSEAQIVKLPKFLLFGNVTYANPTGDFSNLYKGGVGAEVGGGLGLGRNLLYVSTGFMNYNAKSFAAGKMSVAPIKVGLRHYILGGLFINGAVGTAVQNFDNSSYNSSAFLYEVGGGIKFLGFIELGAAYQSHSLGNTSTAAGSFLFKGGVALKL